VNAAADVRISCHNIIVVMPLTRSLSLSSLPEIQAVILAGGIGTRIRELTKKKPKCLLPIGNRPMIYYPLKSLIDANFTGE
jgi:hypothetical protein